MGHGKKCEPTRAQPSIMPAAVKVLLASLRSTLTAEAEGWVF